MGYWEESGLDEPGAAAVPAPGLPGEGGTASGTAEPAEPSPFPNNPNIPRDEICVARNACCGYSPCRVCAILFPLRDSSSSGLISPCPAQTIVGIVFFPTSSAFPRLFCRAEQGTASAQPSFASLPTAAARGNEMRSVGSKGRFVRAAE